MHRSPLNQVRLCPAEIRAIYFFHTEDNKQTEMSPVRRIPLHKNIMEQNKSGNTNDSDPEKGQESTYRPGAGGRLITISTRVIPFSD